MATLTSTAIEAPLHQVASNQIGPDTLEGAVFSGGTAFDLLSLGLVSEEPTILLPSSGVLDRVSAMRKAIGPETFADSMTGSAEILEQHAPSQRETAQELTAGPAAPQLVAVGKILG